MSKATIVLPAAGSVVVVAALVAASAMGLGAVGQADQASPRSTFSVERARELTEFPVYSAGRSVDGLPLVAVLRRTDSAADYVSFVYGDCTATPESGCAPPVEIQSWPSCIRNRSLYGRSGPALEPTMVRGVPAALVGRREWLELQTGRATIVVFAASPERMLRVANRLRGVNVAVGDGPLPRPADGAVEGSLQCR